MVDAINHRDLDALDALVAEDFVRHCAATPDVHVTSREDFKEFLRRDFAAVPDSRMEIRRILGEGDQVAVLVTYTGTQRGPMGPFPATGESFQLPFLSILRLEGGKIAEVWVEWDNLNVLAQLGHLPPPPEDVADGGGERDSERAAGIGGARCRGGCERRNGRAAGHRTRAPGRTGAQLPGAGAVAPGESTLPDSGPPTRGL